MDGLKDLSKRYPQHIQNNVRGIGTFCAFDLSSPQKRDETFVRLQQYGLIIKKKMLLTKKELLKTSDNDFKQEFRVALAVTKRSG